jgi:hypothetical protein
MTDADLARIEAELGISLPPSYRELMQTRGTELAGLTEDSSEGLRPWFDPWVFLNPDRVISTNSYQRTPDSAAGYSRPGWWQEYFLCGTDNGEYFYCLRLDGSPEVWRLCGESGAVRFRCGSLEEHVEDRIASHKSGPV